MPIYEYRCRACGHVFEAIRPFRTDAPLPRCPVCEADGPERLPSVFAAGAAQGGGCGGGGFT
jgi:putative FmdB family regulatory protein